MKNRDQWTYREEIGASDREDIRRIVASTGFFSDDEIALAVELVDERLSRGTGSGFFFLIAEATGFPIGYTCFGPVPATKGSYDLYWIAADASHQRMGVGRSLMGRTEALIAGREGSQIYIETSGRPQYAPTRRFYEACGYREAALLKDFYAPGDDKLIYVKVL